jgi:hypothetical protein
MYLYDKEPIDQTMLPAGHESAIEVILRKKTQEEIDWKGNLTEAKVAAAIEIERLRKEEEVKFLEEQARLLKEAEDNKYTKKKRKYTRKKKIDG